MNRRAHLTLTTKLASALLQIRDDYGKPFISWDHAKLMTSTQIISLWTFDHCPIRKEAGGSDHPSNLVPRLISSHRRKTATRDAPEIAKIRRVARAEEEFRARLLAKSQGKPRPKSRWPSRPFPKRRRTP